MTDAILKFQRKRRRGTIATTGTTTITTDNNNNNNINNNNNNKKKKKRHQHPWTLIALAVVVVLTFGGGSLLQINVISKPLVKFIPFLFIGDNDDDDDDHSSNQEGHSHDVVAIPMLEEEEEEWQAEGISNNNNKHDNMLSDSSSTTSVTQQRRRRSRLNVTIMMRYPRNDRMGSNLQRPLNLLAYAHCKGYNFCAVSGRLGPVAELFRFPICPPTPRDDLMDKQLLSPLVGSIFETPVNQSGVYSFQRNDGALLRAISENIACAYAPSFRRTWRNMIFNVHYFSDRHSVASQDLFWEDDQHKGNATNDTTTDPHTNSTNRTIQIAVHIRRGDIGSRHPIYISDATFVATIQKLKHMLVNVLGKRCKVHVFSEAYGDTNNWTAYGKDIVDYFHLAPRMDQKKKHAMDMELNLRDWKHFITADILIVGGTFSRIASYARDDPDSITGLPLTMTMCYDLPCQPSTQFDWSGTYVQFHKEEPSVVEFVNFPPPFDDAVVAAASAATATAMREMNTTTMV